MKIALFLPNWIGDACMAIPAIRAIRQGFGRSHELVAISRPGPAMFLRDQQLFDSFIVYQNRAKPPIMNRRALVRLLRREEFDSAILFPNSFSSAVLAILGRIPRRVGYAADGRSWLLTDRVSKPRYSNGLLPVSAIDSYLRIAEHIGCPSVDREMVMRVTDVDAERAQQLWKSLDFSEDRPTIVINNNAATSPARLWPQDRVVKLAQKLVKNTSIQVLIHCGPREREEARQIETLIADPRVRSMANTSDLPLGLSLGVLDRASLVITTDSGIRSMAVSLNKQVISLFGPTKPEWTASYNIPEVIIRADDPCLECRKTSPGKNESGPRCTCMQSISVERVYTAAIMKIHDRPIEQARFAA